MPRIGALQLSQGLPTRLDTAQRKIAEANLEQGIGNLVAVRIAFDDPTELAHGLGEILAVVVALAQPVLGIVGKVGGGIGAQEFPKPLRGFVMLALAQGLVGLAIKPHGFRAVVPRRPRRSFASDPNQRLRGWRFADDGHLGRISAQAQHRPVDVRLGCLAHVFDLGLGVGLSAGGNPARRWRRRRVQSHGGQLGWLDLLIVHLATLKLVAEDEETILQLFHLLGIDCVLHAQGFDRSVELVHFDLTRLPMGTRSHQCNA